MNLDTLNVLTGVEALTGSFANAFADISQSNYVAQQFQFNEQIAKIQSEEAINAGTVEQEISQEKTGQLSGQQQASEAAQGVSVNSGTAVITRQQTSEIGGKDYLTIGNNAFLKSLGYQIQGVNDKSEAVMTKEAGVNKATNTLLGGANDFYRSTMKAVAYDNQANQASPNNL